MIFNKKLKKCTESAFFCVQYNFYVIYYKYKMIKR
nr:MAG TPA: hypothetical protein [Caudoviricetes sp.]